MIAVTATSGITQLANGTDWGITEGYLTVVDSTGASVASFAPGAWQSVEQVPS